MTEKEHELRRADDDERSEGARGEAHRTTEKETRRDRGETEACFREQPHRADGRAPLSRPLQHGRWPGHAPHEPAEATSGVCTDTGVP